MKAFQADAVEAELDRIAAKYDTSGMTKEQIVALGEDILWGQESEEARKIYDLLDFSEGEDVLEMSFGDLITRFLIEKLLK